MNISEAFDYALCISFQRDLEYIIVLSYALPSLVVYLLVVYVLFRRLRSPFYRIFAAPLATGRPASSRTRPIRGASAMHPPLPREVHQLVVYHLLDISGWLIHFISARAVFYPSMFWLFDSMPKSGFTPTLLYFLSYYFTFAPYASTFSLTLNRCLAAFSVRGGRQKWFAPLAYITTLLFPLPLTWYIWWSEVDLHHLDDNDPCAGFMFGYKVPPWGLRKSMFLSVASFVQGVVVLAMNVAIGSKLFLRRKRLNVGAARVEDTRDAEIKLFLLTLIVFVYNISTCVCQVYFYVGGILPKDDVVVLLNVQTFGEDLHVCTAPWFLVLMSAAVRTELRNTLGMRVWRRKSTVGVVIHVTSSTGHT
ncbi:hypothetical protein AAVH_21545 [Aphelenchoides avenae]|nr:hypothetical protein AAVH_21545 [Aphelenchus avenae]